MATATTTPMMTAISTLPEPGEVRSEVRSDVRSVDRTEDRVEYRDTLKLDSCKYCLSQHTRLHVHGTWNILVHDTWNQPGMVTCWGTDVVELCWLVTVTVTE